MGSILRHFPLVKTIFQVNYRKTESPWLQPWGCNNKSILPHFLRILAIETKFMTSKIAELLFPLFFDKVFGSSIKNTPVLGKTC